MVLASFPILSSRWVQAVNIFSPINKKVNCSMFCLRACTNRKKKGKYQYETTVFHVFEQEKCKRIFTRRIQKLHYAADYCTARVYDDCSNFFFSHRMSSKRNDNKTWLGIMECFFLVMLARLFFLLKKAFRYFGNAFPWFLVRYYIW